MNTLKSYDTIIKHVTDTNNLAARLKRDEITTKDAMAIFKKLLKSALGKLD